MCISCKHIKGDFHSFKTHLKADWDTPHYLYTSGSMCYLFVSPLWSVTPFPPSAGESSASVALPFGSWYNTPPALRKKRNILHIISISGISKSSALVSHGWIIFAALLKIKDNTENSGNVVFSMCMGCSVCCKEGLLGNFMTLFPCFYVFHIWNIDLQNDWLAITCIKSYTNALTHGA